MLWVERTHNTSSSQDPRGRLWVRAKDLLALVVCPEATETVAHLSEPCARNAIVKTSETSRSDGLPHGLDHALIARGL